jgi:hypothetical protein
VWCSFAFPEQIGTFPSRLDRDHAIDGTVGPTMILGLSGGSPKPNETKRALYTTGVARDDSGVGALPRSANVLALQKFCFSRTCLARLSCVRALSIALLATVATLGPH